MTPKQLAAKILQSCVARFYHCTGVTGVVSTAFVVNAATITVAAGAASVITVDVLLPLLLLLLLLFIFADTVIAVTDDSAVTGCLLLSLFLPAVPLYIAAAITSVVVAVTCDTAATAIISVANTFVPTTAAIDGGSVCC